MGNNVTLAEFKKMWIGRTFRCLSTGHTITLTEDIVRPKAFIAFGDSYIDLGDGYYSRAGGNFEEVKDEDKK